ncbi:FAD/FMN-binding oxidoreductase [Clostridium botulinum]|nr:FAD/FMN-binding oxidoreductase [Clostridium botulinum]
MLYSYYDKRARRDNMKSLFEKTNIKNLEIKNRFIRSATWDRMSEDDGHLNNEVIKRYSKKIWRCSFESKKSWI